MKKVLAVFLMSVMVISMTACGSGINDGASDQNSQSSSIGDPSGSSSEKESMEDVDSQDENNVAADGEAQEENQPEENSTEGSAEVDVSTPGSHILVAYFSRVGNTDWEDGVDAVSSASLNVRDGEFFGNAQLLAQMAQQATGGDLFLIQTEETYPSDYRETTDAAKVEQNENARPALSSHVENMDQYDTVVLIYPNWWGTLPQPLYTFLEEYDFSGKTILPLCTHEGSRMGSSENAIAGICPDAVLLEGLSVRGSDAPSAQSEVEAWIDASGILE